MRNVGKGCIGFDDIVHGPGLQGCGGHCFITVTGENHHRHAAFFRTTWQQCRALAIRQAVVGNHDIRHVVSQHCPCFVKRTGDCKLRLECRAFQRTADEFDMIFLIIHQKHSQNLAVHTAIPPILSITRRFDHSGKLLACHDISGRLFNVK